MSGSIGGNRILRKNVKDTIYFNYLNILMGYRDFRECCITGSYNTGIKKDHGDIDLCIYIDSKDDLKTIKKDFQKYLESKSDLEIVPFRVGKNQGKKTQLYGNIVTCQIPIRNQEGEYVQVDNIITKSKQSMMFVKNFLDLDAQRQTLFTALVRVIPYTIRLQDVSYLCYKDIKIPQLKNNQEFEFVLSMFNISLRVVTLDDNYKEIDRETIWTSDNWDHARMLIQEGLGQNSFFKFEDYSFEDLLDNVSIVYDYDIRARRRICGIMNSMINIGPGEINTPKGDNKQKAIDLTYQKLNIEK